MEINKTKLIFFLFLLVLIPLVMSDVKIEPTDYKDFKVNHIFADVTFKEDIKSYDKEETLKSRVSFTNGKVEINSRLYPELNKPATIKFKGLYYKNPIVLHNGVWDKSITPKFISFGTWEIDVPGFSYWEIVDNTWTGTFNQTDISGVYLQMGSDAQLYSSYDDNITTTAKDYSKNDYEGETSEFQLFCDDDDSQGSCAWFSGASGNGLHFDGSNGVVTVSDSADIEINNSITVSLWASLSGSNHRENLVGKYEFIGTPFGYLMYTPAGNNNVYFEVGGRTPAGTTTTQALCGTVPDNGFLHHLVGVYNGTHVFCFINGTGENAPVSTNLVSLNAEDNDEDLYFGSNNGEYVFNGTLDEISIRNCDVNESEALLQFNTPTYWMVCNNGSDYINGIWTLNQSGGNMVPDDFEMSLGTITKFIRPIWMNDHGFNETGIWNFTGYNWFDYGNIFPPQYGKKALFSDGTNWTISFWMENNDWSSAQWVLGKTGSNVNCPGGNQFWGAYFHDDDKMQFRACDGDEFVVNYATVDTTTGLNHYAFVHIENEDLTYYQNGVEIGSFDSSSFNNFNNSGNFQVGSVYASSGGFNGLIDEVKIFDRALTSTEIINLNNTNPLMIYYTSGDYISEVYFTQDYDTQIQANLWTSVRFNMSDCSNLTAVYGRTGSVENVEDQSWTLGTDNDCVWNMSLDEGEAFQYKADVVGGNNDTFSIYNVNVTSHRYYRPYVVNITIFPNNVYFGGTVYGNSTYMLNDTDAGNLTFRWFINGVYQETDVVSGLTNGQVGEATFTDSFVHNDVVYFTVQANNSGVAGLLNQSVNLTINNTNFTIESYTPLVLNFTRRIGSSVYFTVTISDVDGDVDGQTNCTWVTNNPLSPEVDQTGRGKTFTMETDDYALDDLVTTTVNCGDGVHNETVSWIATMISPASGDNTIIAIIIGLAILGLILIGSGSLLITRSVK